MKILVVKNYSIGNVLLSTPLLRVLKQLGHEIVVIVEHLGYEVLRGNPNLSGVWSWYPGQGDHEHQLEEAVKRTGFDLAINSIPTHGDNADRFLRHAKDQWTTGRIETWTRHEADMNLDYARQLGWTGDWEPSECWVPDEVDDEAETRMGEIENDRPVVGLHFGCVKHRNWIYKRWPIESFMATMQILYTQFRCRFMLVGGAAERDEADQIMHSLDPPLSHDVMDFVGHLSLKQTAAFIKHCQVFISNDS